jgi:hypothetical protein
MLLPILHLKRPVAPPSSPLRRLVEADPTIAGSGAGLVGGVRLVLERRIAYVKLGRHVTVAPSFRTSSTAR